MKNIFLILCLCFGFLSGNAQEPVKAPKENGKYEEKVKKIIRVSGTCTNGLKTGLWIYNDEFGFLTREEEFGDDGVLIRSLEHTNGYWQELSYEKGVLHGRTRTSYLQLTDKTDKLLMSGWYEHGKKDSTWYYYRWGMGLWKTEKWKTDSLAELCTCYANGNLFDRIVYDEKGAMIYQLYYDQTGSLLDSLWPGKEEPDSEKSKPGNDALDSETQPVFPGGEAAFFSYLQKNIRYPQKAKENNKQGTVFVSFVVNKYGKIGEVSIVKGINGAEDLSRETIRIIEMMPPWTPGKINGRPVKVTITQPVKFVLQ